MLIAKFEQEAQLFLWKANRTTYVQRPAADFQSQRESDLAFKVIQGQWFLFLFYDRVYATSY